jgi:hypothetical protein
MLKKRNTDPGEDPDNRKKDGLNNQRLMMNTKTALLLVMTLGFLLAACGNDKSFDSAAWLKGDIRTRGRMCDDLVKRKVLIGQTADEAQRLLGQGGQGLCHRAVL